MHSDFSFFFFFFNATATTEIYTLSLHDALPICSASSREPGGRSQARPPWMAMPTPRTVPPMARARSMETRRSEEHTSELQSQSNLVCRLLLEEKNKNYSHTTHTNKTPISMSIIT